MIQAWILIEISRSPRNQSFHTVPEHQLHVIEQATGLGFWRIGVELEVSKVTHGGIDAFRPSYVVLHEGLTSSDKK